MYELYVLNNYWYCYDSRFFDRAASDVRGIGQGHEDWWIVNKRGQFNRSVGNKNWGRVLRRWRFEWGSDEKCAWKLSWNSMFVSIPETCAIVLYLWIQTHSWWPTRERGIMVDKHYLGGTRPFCLVTFILYWFLWSLVYFIHIRMASEFSEKLRLQIRV